jgi:PucR family transcriptional regulator, purine catabolism regulatory protein
MDSGFTVADALTVPAMKHASLVAGETGLQNVVRWVHILDIPDVVPWVSPGDLVLTSCYQFSVRAETVNGLVPRLADKRVAGMVLGLGAYLDDVPRQLIVDANRRGFPLVKISARIRFEDVTHQLISKLLYNPQQILQRADQAAAEMSVAVGSTTEIQSLCDAIAGILHKDVILAVPSSAPVRSQGVSEAALRELEAHFGRGATHQHAPGPSRVAGRRLMLRPLVAGERVIGQIGVISDTELTPLDLLNVSHLAGLISVKLAVQRERNRAIQSSRTEFLRQALMSSPSETVDLQARANLLGLREGEAYVVVAAHPSAGVDSAQRGLLRDALVDVAATLTAGSGPPFMLETEGATLMLVPLRGLPEGSGSVRDALQRALRGATLPVTIGISEEGRGLADAPSRLGQATRAADLAGKLHGQGSVRSFAEMRAYDLLDQVAATNPEVEFTIVPGLRELFDADEERGLDLVDTVRTYLRCGGNLERTAARLFLHRNSVRYRIERARGYLGTSLSDPGQWLQLEMALAIHSLRQPPRNNPRRRV